MTIHYSRGANQYDNRPQMRMAADFEAFEQAILGDRAHQKGGPWFAAPFNHDGRRSKDNVEPRRFLALDFDHIDVRRLPELRLWLHMFRGFGYTTASNTEAAPRERAVLELSRPVTRAEGIRINKWLVRSLARSFSDDVALDSTVFRGEQPVYLPFTSAQVLAYRGQVLDADLVLEDVPDDEPEPAPREEVRNEAYERDPVYRTLRRKEWIKSHRQDGGVNIVCPFSSTHTTGANETETIYYPPHTGGYTHSNWKCMHAHCGDRTRLDFERELFKDEPGREGNANAPPEPGNYFYRELSGIEAVPVHWLWKGRIARGKLTLIAGHPGLGKSQTTASMAAIVSSAGVWPVDNSRCEVGNVVILSAEDDAGDTLRPRLEAAGADLTKVFVFDAIRNTDGTARPFDLKRDLGHLADMVLEIGGAALVIIDPVSAYLGDTDSHVNAEVRALLAPVAVFASRLDVAVVAVSHFSKSNNGEAVTRVTGSMAFTAAVRAAYVVVKDKDDESRRLFLPSKNNLGIDDTGFAFGIEHAEIESRYGLIGTSKVVWEDELVTVSADEAMPGTDADDRSALNDAKEFLQDLLAPAPMQAKQVRREADDAGYSWATIRRAKRSLGVLSVKTHGNGPWCWRLPNQEQGAQGAQGAQENVEHLS